MIRVTLKFEQGLVINDKTDQYKETDRLKLEISRLSSAMKQLQHRQDSLRLRNYIGLRLLNEIRPLYPQVSSCFFAESYIFSDSTAAKPLPQTYAAVSSLMQLNPVTRKKISLWLKARLQNETLRVVFEYSHDSI